MIEDHQATLLQSSGTKRTSSNDNSLRPLVEVVEYWGMAGDDVKNRPKNKSKSRLCIKLHIGLNQYGKGKVGNSPAAMEDDAK